MTLLTDARATSPDQSASQRVRFRHRSRRSLSPSRWTHWPWPTIRTFCGRSRINPTSRRRCARAWQVST